MNKKRLKLIFTVLFLGPLSSFGNASVVSLETLDGIMNEDGQISDQFYSLERDFKKATHSQAIWTVLQKVSQGYYDTPFTKTYVITPSGRMLASSEGFEVGTAQLFFAQTKDGQSSVRELLTEASYLSLGKIGYLPVLKGLGGIVLVRFMSIEGANNTRFIIAQRQLMKEGNIIRNLDDIARK